MLQQRSSSTTAAAGQQHWQHTPGDKTGPQKRPPQAKAAHTHMCQHTHTSTTNMHTAHPHIRTHNLNAGAYVRCGHGSSKVWGSRCTCGRLKLLVQTSQQKGQIQGGAACLANCSGGPLASHALTPQFTCGTTTHTNQPQQKQDAKNCSTTKPLGTHSTLSQPGSTLLQSCPEA